VASNVALYARLAIPTGSDGVAIFSGPGPPGVINRLNGCVEVALVASAA